MSALIPVGQTPATPAPVALYASTLADFRSQFLDWLNRTDISNAQAVNFINLGIARCSRELRLPAMENDVVVEANGLQSEGITLPDDFLEARTVEADGHACYPLTINQLQRIPPTVGRGSCYARDMGTLKFRPYFSTYARLVYYSAFPQLSADTDTTTLFAVSSPCLLFAALSYAGDFLRMDQTTTWEQRYQAERDKLNQQALDVDTLGQPMQVQPGISYPAY